MKKYLVASLLIFSMALSAGCGSSNSSSSSQNEAETERWNSYVAVSNSMQTINTALDKYLETFGNQKEWGKTEKTMSFTNSILGGPQIDSVTKAIDKANELSAKGSSDLDKGTLKMITPLKELWGSLTQASSYYRNKDYIDDNYAKAKTLHEKIISMYPVFDEAFAEFNTLMDQKAREIRKSEIKEMKESGHVIMAAMLQAIDSAKNMQDILHRQQITSKNLQELNIGEFRVAYDEYVKCLNEYEKVSSDEKQVKKEKIDTYSISNVMNGLKGVKASAAGLIEFYQKNSKIPSTTTTGAPEHFDQQMSYLVTKYNQAISSQ